MLTIDTNGAGVVTAECHRCTWQLAGRCWQCSKRRESQSGHAVFCAACALQRRLDREQAIKADELCVMRRRLAQRRLWREGGEARRAKKRQWSKAWRDRNPEKVKQYKRKSALNPTKRRRERERWWNSQPERIEKKRAMAKAAYYKRHPTRPSPTCKGCSVAIHYIPPGRPKSWCDTCVRPADGKHRKAAA